MKNYFYRYFWFTVGVIISSLGIAVVTKAALGTSPISGLAYVLSLRYTMTFGQFSFAINMIFILLQVAILRQRFERIQLLQIVVNIVFSAFIDVGMALMAWFEPSTMFSKFTALFVGCAIMALGISIQVAPRVLMVPGEGLVFAIARVGHARFGNIKVLFDSTLVLLAAILSFLFFKGIVGLGIGTVISALLIGQLVKFYYNHLNLLTRIEQLACANGQCTEKEMAVNEEAISSC